MTREEITADVVQIFRKAFDDEGLELTDGTSAADIEDWDSLMHITLVTAMEDHFKIKFRLKEVTGLQNVGETIDLIQAKLG